MIVQSGLTTRPTLNAYFLLEIIVRNYYSLSQRRLEVYLLFCLFVGWLVSLSLTIASLSVSGKPSLTRTGI